MFKMTQCQTVNSLYYSTKYLLLSDKTVSSLFFCLDYLGSGKENTKKKKWKKQVASHNRSGWDDSGTTVITVCCKSGNLMGMQHMMTLFPFSSSTLTAVFQQAHPQHTALHLGVHPSHHVAICSVLSCVTWGIQEVKNYKRRIPAVYENDKWATHMDNGSLSLKDPSLGEESTL